MTEPEPGTPSVPPSARLARALVITIVLIAVMFTMVRSTARELRTPAARREAQAARLYLAALYTFKTAYVLGQFTPANTNAAGLRDQNRRAVRSVQEFAGASPSIQHLRMLAIAQAAFADPAWRQTIRNLATCKPSLASSELADEIALWADVFGTGKVAPANAPSLDRRIRAMKLGWFENPPLIALYRKTGDQDRAQSLLVRQGASIGALIVLVLGGIALGLIGVVAGTVIIAAYAKTRRLPAFLPARMQATPPTLRTPRQADLLYGVFTLYIGSFLAIRLIRDHVMPAPASGVHTSPTASAVLSLAATALVFAIPFLMLVIVGPRVGLRLRDIGLRGRPLWPEIAWGVLAYAMILPVVVVVALLSELIPGAKDSAIHPIFTEMAGSAGLLDTAILFALAAIVAPLAEETMFRGVFFNAIAPRVGVAWSIVIGSLVFSLLHPQLPVGGPAIFVLGAAFSMLYVTRGSLVASMVAHAINNAAALALMMLLFAG